MVGVHGQYPINNWLEAIKIFPTGTPFLAVNDIHMLRDAKAVNPGLLTIFRKKVDVQPFTSDYEQAKQRARDYFNSFIDGTWQQQGLWQFVAAEHLQTGERRVYYAVVPNWSNVQWFKM